MVLFWSVLLCSACFSVCLFVCDPPLNAGTPPINKLGLIYMGSTLNGPFCLHTPGLFEVGTLQSRKGKLGMALLRVNQSDISHLGGANLYFWLWLNKMYPNGTLLNGAKDYNLGNPSPLIL